jgi:muramoyltetrapeptide carboxypeptidase
LCLTIVHQLVRFQLPPRLTTGARVALIAPAGPLRERSELECAESNARLLGWIPVAGEHVLARNGYLAGTDEQRLNDLNWAIRDLAIDAIWCVRGGYGVLRVLEGLDLASLRCAPKALIGFSDITALHAAVGTLGSVVSFHGPFPNRPLSEFSRSSLERAVSTGKNPAGVASEADVLVPGRARGRLAGGNLALLSALAGTPYFPQLEGAILVLEDVNEPVYRIDRMLRHLRLTGALGLVAGLLFGAFTERGDEGETLPLAQVLRETAEAVGVPCLAGVPVGHIADQWTLPLGAEAEMDAGSRLLTIDDSFAA